MLIQGVSSISPAGAALFTLAFIVSNVGVTAPLAYLGAFVIALMLGYVLAQFSKYLTSTGSYYTYVSNSLGARAGFLAGWVYLLFYPVSVAQAAVFMGDSLQNTLKAEYGWAFEWWWFVTFIIVLVALTTYLGIQLSVGLMIVLGVIETLIVVALAIAGFADPGPGGVNFQWLNPHNAPSGHSLFLGVVFAIFAISGWDSAAPLGEESEDPKKTIPRGVMGCILILGVVLIFSSWGQIAGWGTDNVGTLSNSSELPALVLGHKYWGGAWVIVLIALVNSVIATSIASANTATRFIYGMAKTGVFPRRLTSINKRKTPTGAIVLQTLINIGLGIGLPLAIGVANVWNVTGTWFTFATAPVFATANVGLFFYVRRNHPDDFSWFKHAIVPLMGIVALALVVYYSLTPLPPWPIKLAPLIVVSWFGLGVAVLVAMILSGKESLLAHAKDAAADRIETPEERAARYEFI